MFISMKPLIDANARKYKIKKVDTKQVAGDIVENITYVDTNVLITNASDGDISKLVASGGGIQLSHVVKIRQCLPFQVQLDDYVLIGEYWYKVISKKFYDPNMTDHETLFATKDVIDYV